MDRVDVVIEIWYRDGSYKCETCNVSEYLQVLDNFYSKKVRSFRVYFYI